MKMSHSEFIPNNKEFSRAESQSAKGILYENYPLDKLTSWRVGGAARYFYQPADLVDLQKFLIALPADFSLPIFWLGAGTNVLIRDSGVDGLVICVRDCLIKCEQLTDDTILAEAGVPCARLLQIGSREGMLDMVFLAGIPGTVGGALAMNAGAYGDSIWPHIDYVQTINRRGEIKQRATNEFQATYRQVSGLVADEWFVSGCLRFVKNDAQLTKARIQELLQKRRATQPLDKFNCGSVFRNPPSDYAARLIEASGLKGVRIGGAEVSTKHANFIINDGTATAHDIECLMEHVTNVVYERYGIKLEREVRII